MDFLVYSRGVPAAQEPYNQAGLFEAHSVWSFINILGRTMWQFEPGADEPRFLVLARGAEDRATAAPVPVADLPAQVRDRLIVYGALRDPADLAPAGLALAVQAPDREAVDALFGARHCGFGAYPRVDVHDWEFGGRR